MYGIQSQSKKKNDAPTMSEVIIALENQKKFDGKFSSLQDEYALRYHRRHRNDEEYLRKLKEAMELSAARKNINHRQPLMPMLSSNQRDYGRQQQYKSPRTLLDRDRHRSSSPNTIRYQYQSPSVIMKTGGLCPRTTSSLLANHRDEEYQPDADKSLYSTMSSSPVMEKSRFYSNSRAKRSPTPINDDHIVHDDWDLDSNSPELQNNNGIDAVTPSVSASNSQGDEVVITTPFVMGTLKNIDNSCYMNSLLYILRMTPTFVHSIHHLLQNMHFISDQCNDNDSSEMIVTSGECLQMVATSVMMSNKEKWPSQVNIDSREEEVIYRLHQIFSKINTNEMFRTNEPIEKKEFQAAVRAIAPYFTEGTQEDAHEFLLIVLNCIRDCGKTLTKLIQDHASMFDNIIDPASRLSFDLIEKNFIGKELTTTKCVCCETISNRVEDVMYFYIPLPEKTEFHKQFFQQSCLTREYLDKIKCEQCQHSQESIQFKSYPQLPRILIFQLGRFDNWLNKKKTIAPTPLELDCFCTSCMKNQNREECIDHKYRLYGVNVHLGETLRSGHYIAYVRTFNKDEQQQQPKNLCKSNSCCQLKFEEIETEKNTANGSWYKCNDEIIDVISETEFQNEVNGEYSKRTPYILFYVRNDHLANY